MSAYEVGTVFLVIGMGTYKVEFGGMFEMVE